MISQDNVRLNRWRLQFGLGSLFVLMLLASAPLGWLSSEVRRAARQKRAVDAVVGGGGLVSFGDKAIVSYDGPRSLASLSRSPWLASLLGDEFLKRAVLADFATGAAKISRGERVPWRLDTRDADLAPLDDLPDLQFLGLRGAVHVTDEGLLHIVRLRNLRELDLCGAAITDAGLRRLKGLSRLEELDLTCTKITDDGLRELEGFARLKRLVLFGLPVADDGLKYVGRLASLKELRLDSHLISDRGLDAIARLTALRELSLHSPLVSDRGLAALSRLTGLRRLFVESPLISDEGLKHLARLSRLEELDLPNSFPPSRLITDEGLRHLTRLSDLKELNLRATRVTPEGAAAFHLALPYCKINLD